MNYVTSSNSILSFFFFKEMKEEYDEFDDDGMEMKDEEMSEDEGILF